VLGLPVTECPLWVEPNAISAQQSGVALKAAKRLAENRTVVEDLGVRSFLQIRDDLGPRILETS
jgi:hypothetical protein